VKDFLRNIWSEIEYYAPEILPPAICGIVGGVIGAVLVRIAQMK